MSPYREKIQKAWGQVWQILGFEFLRVREEADNAQRIAWELRTDQARSASATFLAAAKRLKRSIDPLISMSSTVEHRDTDSEPCTGNLRGELQGDCRRTQQSYSSRCAPGGYRTVRRHRLWSLPDAGHWRHAAPHVLAELVTPQRGKHTSGRAAWLSGQSAGYLALSARAACSCGCSPFVAARSLIKACT